MPLKLSIGLSRKNGLPDYGSLGAHCQIELELEAALLSRDPVSLGDQARRAFAACAEAVEEALTRHRPADARSCSQGRAAANGRSVHSFTPLPATARQLEYARQLAAQVPGLEEPGLEAFVQQHCGKPQLVLNRGEASQLIEVLRQLVAGGRDNLPPHEDCDREADARHPSDANGANGNHYASGDLKLP